MCDRNWNSHTGKETLYIIPQAAHLRKIFTFICVQGKKHVRNTLSILCYRMSCKHSTPPPQPQRACPERPPKANLTYSFGSFPGQLLVVVFFKGHSFVKRKLKFPPSHPFPSLQPNHFYCFWKKKNSNKNPHITHNPTLKTANLDTTARSRLPGEKEGKSKRAQGLLVVSLKFRERGWLLK